MAEFTFGSLFAGIGGFDLGFERAGMRARWQVEVDGQCNEVLAHHWPDVERLEDVRYVGRQNLRPVDLICGGFPCQDVSVAGKREGLSGERSGLWFQFYRILKVLRPRWVVVENVPGLLSSNGGRDFATILRGLAELRYGVVWRVLDAQYFGVAQRRRRVFIVGCFGRGSGGQVLLESEGGVWDSPPSREAGQGIADNTISRPLTSSQQRIDAETESCCITPWDHESKRIHNSEGSAPTIAGSDGGGGQRMPYVTVWDNGQGDPNAEESEVAYCVNPQMNQGVATVGALQARDFKGVGNQFVNEGKVVVSPTIGADIARQAGGHPGIEEYTNSVMEAGFGVRRLTPTECERLQGFPDGWTAVNGMADSPRYRMLGNAVAVPVAEWLGRRIMDIDWWEREHGGGE